jgi:photosystem II stability/assembly factor-like uncharacterized protein
MSGKPRFRQAVNSIALPLLLAVPVVAPAQQQADYSSVMPLAARSLLLDIAPAGERLVVVGEHGHVLYSDDGGSSWQQARVPTRQMLTAVYFVSPRHGWAVGHDGLVLTTDDAGENWRIQRDGLADQLFRNRKNREDALARVDALQRALADSPAPERDELEAQLEDAEFDLEDAEQALEAPVFASPLMDVWFQDPQRGWAVGAFGTMLVTGDGGEHWSSRPDLVDNPEELHLNAITGDGSGRLLVAGESGLLYRSLDAGVNWESLEPVYEGSWFGALYSDVRDNLLVFGLRGHLYRSEDFGDSWEAVPWGGDTTLAGGTASRSGAIALAGGVGHVLLSRDGGLTFAATVMPHRAGLSSALLHDGLLTVVGQGGVQTRGVEGMNE